MILLLTVIGLAFFAPIQHSGWMFRTQLVHYNRHDEEVAEVDPWFKSLVLAVFGQEFRP